MSVATVFDAAPEDEWLPEFLNNNGSGSISSTSTTKVTFTSVEGFKVTITGTGFAFDSDGASAGTVKSVAVFADDGTTKFMTVTGLSLDLQELYPTLFGSDGGNGPDPRGAFAEMLATNGTINGSDHDDILGGYSPGNDVVNGKGGQDIIEGDAGNDSLYGGGHGAFDTVSYDQSFGDPTAFQGIVLNTATGTVTDCWGGHDTVSGFTEYNGSAFGDVMTGSNVPDEQFMGLKGDDVINGKGGYDEVYYFRDAEFGGTAGINANLGTGKIIDGWGDTDTVTGIEGVCGTQSADVFIGDSHNNLFQGIGGVDSYVGGGGDDRIDFSPNTWSGAFIGATVDLSKSSGQIVNDGYGNTETETGVENISGADLVDHLTGDGKANYLFGRDGNDVISGGGGPDRLEGGNGRDNVTGGAGADKFNFFEDGAANADKITDFKESDGDQIYLADTTVFTGLSDGTLPHNEFRSGAGATAAANARQRVIYNTSNGNLYFDHDGVGGDVAVLIATLTNHAALSNTDIIIAG